MSEDGVIEAAAVLMVKGRRLTLRVDPETDGAGQFRVSVLVDGAMTGRDTEIWAGFVTDHSEDTP